MCLHMHHLVIPKWLNPSCDLVASGIRSQLFGCVCHEPIAASSRAVSIATDFESA